MAEWKGCRGLDPAVAAQVTNAMPPYLIGIESVSPVPFSASNKATWRQTAPSETGITAPDLGNLTLEPLQDQDPSTQTTGLPSKATCWEILTVRLGRYANGMTAQNIVLTDEMLQAEARRILYDSDDSWNQTAADNPEWLDLFKKAHGLDFIPDAVGGQGDAVPEDLETYGDLGLRIPFSVQLQAYNQSQGQAQLCHLAELPAQDGGCQNNQRNAELDRIWRTLSKEGVLHDANGKCKHTECEDNLLDTSMISGAKAKGAKQFRWCNYELPPQKAKDLAKLAQPLTHEKASLQEFTKQLANQQEGSLYQEMQAAAAKAQALTALTHAECCGGVLENCPSTVGGTKSYLQRHKYSLPADRAQQFATTTGPWEDSGTMPAPISTASIDLGPNITSTGAMMEFLGGELGRTLPFSADAETSTIPINSEFGWNIPISAAEEAAMMEDVDRLIAETTLPQSQPSVPADVFSGLTTFGDFPVDMAMDDMNFDMEMDFDGVFDMPLDETFGPSS